MNQNGEFRLLPRQASTISEQVDALFTFLVSVSGFFVVLIFILIVYFALKYHRDRQVNRVLHPAHNRVWMLEVFWSVVPLVLVMIMFGWGATLYYQQHAAPESAMEINVIGKQWMWKLQHPDGRREINQLHVPVGEPVRLRMISEDVIHSFYVPDFRMKMDVLPGRYTSAWFEATKVGTYHLFCAEYCGTNHSGMHGQIVVMTPSEFAAWQSAQTPHSPPLAGRALFEKFRCPSCHEQAPGRSPRLAGVYGQRVPLADGQATIANEDYLRESILDPSAQIVAGYSPIMPSFRGQLDEEAVLQLIAYIKSLRDFSGQTAQVGTP